jgi:proteasome accessory factor C
VSAQALRRLRRLLLLLPAASRAARQGRGVPLARAAAITGARSEAEVAADVAAVAGLWIDPGLSEDVLDLQVENGEVTLTYAHLFASPVALSVAEGAVLLAALAPFERDGGRPVQALARKIRRAVPDPLRAAADRLARGLDVGDAAPGPWAGTLREAIAKRVETFLDYRSVADGTLSRRTVEPRLLFQRDGRWYLAAWNVTKGEEHLFRLDRIAEVELGTRVFGAHRGPPVGRYARRKLYFPSGAEREVAVRYRGVAARLARAQRGPRARVHPDGSVTIAARLAPGNYLHGVVLGHGGEAEVEGPPDVARAFRERVEELARLYR